MRRAVLVAAFLAGCSGNQKPDPFATAWQGNGAQAMSQLAQRLDAAPPAGPAVAVGVGRSGLVATLLDGSGTWSYRAELDARPVIAGNLVVASGESRAFALDARSGRLLWSVISRGQRLVGAGDDGKLSVLSMAELGGGRSILVVNRSGDVIRRYSPLAPTGNPAAVGGHAFIPWGEHNVSAIDLESGEEVARLALPHTVSHALNIGGELYFGEQELTRFDAAIGQPDAHHLTLPESDLPGNPIWHGNGTRVSLPDAQPKEQARLLARPSFEGGTLGLSDQAYAAVYQSIVLGLSSSKATLHWVHTLPRGVVGGAAAQGGFVLCMNDGRVLQIDVRGGSAPERALGQPLRSCVVQAGDHRVSATSPPAPLSEQLSAAVQLPDSELLPAQRWLLGKLAERPDAEVTQHLIEIAVNPRTPPVLAEETGKLIAQCRSGKEHMLAALEDHYDYLSESRRPPPVGALAEALAAMGEQRAAPLLAEHLNDPANSAEDARRVAKALAALATAEEYDDLRTFFTLYRATADQSALIEAVLSVAKALHRVGGERGHQLLEQAADDPLTHPAVKQGISEIVRSHPHAVGSTAR